MGTRRKTGRKRIVKSRTSYGLCNGSKILISDNSGAKVAKIVNVDHKSTRQRRLPQATVGDLCTVSIRKGKPELRGNLLKAVIIRQRRIVRRVDGTRLCFEDNAGVIVSPEGEPKGTEVRGPVAREAAEVFPRLASISSLII
jgi:large subunit ribosomal protein L14